MSSDPSPSKLPTKDPSKTIKKSDRIKSTFEAMDKDHNGRITAAELKHALLILENKAFADKVCALLLRLFDTRHKNELNMDEFTLLNTYITQWVSTFDSVDVNKAGYLEEEELQVGLEKMGFQFSEDFVKLLVNYSDPIMHRVTLDDFVTICVQIQRSTTIFHRLDSSLRGTIMLTIDNYMDTLLNLILDV